MMYMNAVVMNLLEKGLPNLLLSFAEPFFYALIVYWFMRKLLPTRLNICALIAMALVYAVWYNLKSSELLGTSYHFWMNMFINAWTYFVIIFLFEGKFLKKLIVWWYFDIIKTMCQAVSYVPILLYHASRGFHGDWAQIVSSVEADAVLKFLHIAVFVPLFLLLGYLSLTIWRRIIMQKFQPFYLLFIALPMGLRYSLSHVIRPNMGDWFFGILVSFGADTMTAYRILALFGVSVSLVASVTLLYYILSYDKRAAIEAELREAKLVMELEQVRYGKMEQRSEELAKIRHDFNNQLASIVQLVHAGEGASAQEMISALSEEVNRTAT